MVFVNATPKRHSGCNATFIVTKRRKTSSDRQRAHSARALQPAMATRAQCKCASHAAHSKRTAKSCSTERTKTHSAKWAQKATSTSGNPPLSLQTAESLRSQCQATNKSLQCNIAKCCVCDISQTAQGRGAQPCTSHAKWCLQSQAQVCRKWRCVAPAVNECRTHKHNKVTGCENFHFKNVEAKQHLVLLELSAKRHSQKPTVANTKLKPFKVSFSDARS